MHEPKGDNWKSLDDPIQLSTFFRVTEARTMQNGRRNNESHYYRVVTGLEPAKDAENTFIMKEAVVALTPDEVYKRLQAGDYVKPLSQKEVNQHLYQKEETHEQV